jgi:ribonuclease BN (tRNA processing enzyme)
MPGNYFLTRTLNVLFIVSFLAFPLCFSGCIQSNDLLPTGKPPLPQSAQSIPGTIEPFNSFRQKGDFSVITLGTGSPIYNPKRSGPCTLVRYKDSYFLVDMGNGTQARLSEAGITIGNLSTLMFTHHHIDHDEEFLPLFIKVWLARGDNVDIIGPAGTRELYDFTARYYQEDMAYRISRTGKEFTGNATMNVRELAGGDRLELNGISIRTTQVTHTILTIAYRFEAEGKSLVISGDTSYSENLIELAKGADILVIDSGGIIMKEYPQPKQPAPQPRRPAPATKENPVRAHSTLQEVATMAEKARVKRMVLTHFGTGEVDKDATASAIKSIYQGEIIFAEDLMEISASPYPAEDLSKFANSPYPIVDTGQNKSYDNTREISNPAPGQPFYGQDAQHQGNQPSYKDNGDGTVTDLVTSLMWQKTPGTKVAYKDAVAGAKSFILAGYTDWRLPTIKELYSLILFSGKDVSPIMAGMAAPSSLAPFLDTRYFDFKYGDPSSGERIIDAQYCCYHHERGVHGIRS